MAGPKWEIIASAILCGYLQASSIPTNTVISVNIEMFQAYFISITTTANMQSTGPESALEVQDFLNADYEEEV